MSTDPVKLVLPLWELCVSGISEIRKDAQVVTDLAALVDPEEPVDKPNQLHACNLAWDFTMKLQLLALLVQVLNKGAVLVSLGAQAMLGNAAPQRCVKPDVLLRHIGQFLKGALWVLDARETSTSPIGIARARGETIAML